MLVSHLITQLFCSEVLLRGGTLDTGKLGVTGAVVIRHSINCRFSVTKTPLPSIAAPYFHIWDSSCQPVDYNFTVNSMQPSTGMWFVRQLTSFKVGAVGGLFAKYFW